MLMLNDDLDLDRLTDVRACHARILRLQRDNTRLRHLSSTLGERCERMTEQLRELRTMPRRTIADAPPPSLAGVASVSSGRSASVDRYV